MGCPSLNELVDFTRGALPAPEHESLSAHLAAGCPRCREDRQWAESVLRLTAEDKSFDFPEHVIARAVALMRPQPATVRTPLIELIAQLVFDSLTPRQIAGVRNEPAPGGVAGRQMLYRVEGYDIDLRFEQTEDGGAEELIGQILPDEKPTAENPEFTVRLLREEQETGRALTDARGIFKFARISSGVYDLAIESRGVEIRISRVGSARAS